MEAWWLAPWRDKWGGNVWRLGCPVSAKTAQKPTRHRKLSHNGRRFRAVLHPRDPGTPSRAGRSDEEGGPIDNRFGFDNSDSPWCIFLLFGTMNMNYELC